jgi:urea transport system permease protein
VVNFAKTYFTGACARAWLFALGALFIGVTLLLPKGIIGTVQCLVRPTAARRSRPKARREAARRRRSPSGGVGA